METYCLTGQSPQWAVAPTEEEEEEGLILKRPTKLSFQSTSPTSHILKH
jgi:hypothetical protein